MIKVEILKGTYRGKPVAGTFGLVRPFNAKGGFITINNPDHEEGTPPAQRIHVQPGDFRLLGTDGAELSKHVEIEGAGGEMSVSRNYEQEFIESETEEEAMQRIDETFLMLDKAVDGSAKNVIRGMVVVGPPGVGKSFGVKKQLEAANMFRTLKGLEPNFEFVTGGISTVGLYQKLYNFRNKDQVLVFDDCDKAVLFEEESITLMKGALQSDDHRRICWNKESRVLLQEGIPNQFDFNGSVIFLSNIDFDASIAKESRISAHLEAIMSRCHYMDLEIGNMRDKLLVVKLRMNQGMLDAYEFDDKQLEDIWGFIKNNHEYLREVSLRMCKKIADLVKADPNGWYELAEATTLQREARFKRLLEKRSAARAACTGVVLAERE